MSDQPLPDIPLPSGRAENVRAAVLHLISLADHAIVTPRSRCNSAACTLAFLLRPQANASSPARMKSAGQNHEEGLRRSWAPTTCAEQKTRLPVSRSAPYLRRPFAIDPSP